MTTVFLIRHGEVEGNSGAVPRFVGWSDKALTEVGEAQAQAVAERLESEHLDAIYASDLQRARHTAERIAAAHGLTVRCESALREASYGLWEGLSEAEITATWPVQWRQRMADAVHVAPPEGECYADVWARWQPAWQEISERHHDQSVAIVAHNGALRILLCHLLGMPFENFRRIHISNAGLTRIDLIFDKQEFAATPRVVVQYINETCHLKNI
ncbi:MAG TPA: histidine phosphatase family protein [Abditibacteriaceae bacterium]|nr:histidine phosphatase family protein [Abditibacteriaceae bacterium]